jgi:hypothetical protein
LDFARLSDSGSVAVHLARAAHALVSLHAAGVIYRVREFVFAPRAAVSFRELNEEG